MPNWDDGEGWDFYYNRPSITNSHGGLMPNEKERTEPETVDEVEDMGVEAETIEDEVDDIDEEDDDDADLLDDDSEDVD